MTLDIDTSSHNNDILIPYNQEFLSDTKNKLLETGFVILPIKLSQKIQTFCHEKMWQSLDDTFQIETKKGMPLFNLLKSFQEIESIEFIISLRESCNEWEEDGIWHDDGSRKIAFSLSLTFDEELQDGGVLEIRKKGKTSTYEIPTPPFGHIIIFLTGIHGYEHKINQVTDGSRLIIAGWGI